MPRDMQPREKLIEDLIYGFVLYCDTCSYTLEEGQKLANDLADELSAAADDRSAYLPEEADDGP